MGTGKYRITKIPRKWKPNDKKKIALKRVIRDDKVEYVDEEENSINITNDYYKIISKNNSKFLGTEEQFIFKVNKMERNIENDCIIMGKYSEEKKKEILEKYEKICIKKIEVEISKKKKVVKYICRNFYENEKDILEKRLDISKKINEMFYNICKDMYDLKYKDYSEEKIYEIFQNKIELKTLIELKEAFKQQEKGLETDRLLAISFNKKRSNILLEFIQEITKQDFENKEKLKKWFSNDGREYCKAIFKIYSDMSQKEKYSKLLGYNKNISSIPKKKETLQRRLKLGVYSDYNIKKYYQKDYKQKAIQELKDKNEEELEKEIEIIIENYYKINELCEELSNLKFYFGDNKKKNKKEMSKIIVKIKKHYIYNVNLERTLEDKEKYILSMIHNYIKGRYRKCLELQQKENVTSENLGKRIKEIFNSKDITKKLKKSIINKINNYKIFEIKISNPNIESSDDLEILKTEETFLNKVSTAISKVGYTLNTLLEVSLKKDILEKYEEVQKLCTNSSIQNLCMVYPEINNNEKLLKGMIYFIQGLRQQVLHPKILWEKNIHRAEKIKEKDRVIIRFQNRGKAYNESEIKTFFDNIEKNMPDYFIEKYKSNNVFSIYRENTDEIIELMGKFKFEDNSIGYLFPKFHKIYKRLNLTQDIDEIKKNSQKYLLQTVYYYYFQFEMDNTKQDTSKYIEIYRNKINKENKKIYSYILENKDKKIEILYKNIQRNGILINKLQKVNNEWIEFIAVQFQEFLAKKELNWIFNNLLEFEEKKEIEKLEEIKNNLELKMVRKKDKQFYSDDIYAFISLSQFLDLREISNLNHGIKKFIQFREKNKNKYNVEKNKCYIEELKKISYVLNVMLEHKERVVQKRYLESYDDDISIVYGRDIEKKDIKDIQIKIKNKNQEIIPQPLYKSGKDESNSWITLYGIIQAKRNGTFKFFKNFFDLNNDIKLCKKDIEKYEKLYNSKEENQKKVDEYISSKGNNNIDIKEINNDKQLFYYYKNMIYGDAIKKGYDFINDIYSHYLSWAYRIERDCKLYKVKEYNNSFRNSIAHFNYFKKTDKSLLEFLNDFYEEFDYSIKYQRDLQDVINNIFEKYQIVRENGGPVVYFDKNENKLKISDNLVPKKHGKYPEIKLIHEKYVEFFKKLFEYKKQGS